MTADISGHERISGARLLDFSQRLDARLEQMMLAAEYGGPEYADLPVLNDLAEAPRHQGPERARINVVNDLLKPVAKAVRRESKLIDGSLSRNELQDLFNQYYGCVTAEKEFLLSTHSANGQVFSQRTLSDNRLALQHLERTEALVSKLVFENFSKMLKTTASPRIPEVSLKRGHFPLVQLPTAFFNASAPSPHPR